MRNFLLSLLGILLFPIYSEAQKLENYDVILDKKVYKSYYSCSIKAPSFVIYKLYHGGGKSSRKGMRFTGKYPHYNYLRSGYDKGHLANAEDFAYSRNLELLTFDYINAIPQTPELNRGTWKSFETLVRKYSQTDSIIIVCGGTDWKGLIPERCFKIVYDLKTKKLLVSEIFNNDKSGKHTRLSEDFIKKFNYQEITKLYNSKKK